MDRNTTLEKQFSSGSSPIAESTSLNINGRNSLTQFHWGGSPTSKMNASKSNDSLSNRSSSNHKNLSANATEQRSIGSRFNNTKIDPRVYADVQSKGLVSRIVKYHDKGNRFNRSLSVNSHYNKPGQFPMVHLKKTEIPHRSIKQNVSMTRIAPPEKSIFYGNTLPSILRSNSAIAVQKSDEELSSENRPILHPPQTKNELAPTRSVLEVLKEISRKRINSEHINQKDDMKKYCSRTVDDISNASSSLQQNKRQREHVNSQQQFTKYNNLSSQQHSPEQMPNKKRLCSYNNDITSSLSSSLIHTNKRTLYESKQNNESESQATSAEQNGQRTKIKQLVPQSELRNEHYLPSSNSKASGYSTSSDATRNEEHSRRPEATGATHMVDGQLSQSGLTKPACTTENAHAFPINKQKLTLFNKNYNECKDIFGAEKSTDRKATTEDGEFSAIPFVKPKKDISIFGSKNPIIVRTQKSKLALMLSGLRGDLYNDEDQLDKKVSSEENIIAASSAEGRNDSTTANCSITLPDKPIDTLTQAKSIILDTNAVEPVTIAQDAVTTTTSAISISPTFNSNIVSVAESKTATKVNDVPVVVTRPLVANGASPLIGIKLTPPATVCSPLLKFSPSSKDASNIESSTAPASSSGPSFTAITATASNPGRFSSPVGTPTISSAIGLPGATNFDSSLSNTFKSPPLLTFSNSKSVAPATTLKFEAVSSHENPLDSSKAITPFSFVSSSIVSSSNDGKTFEPNTNESIPNSSKSSDTAAISKPFTFGMSTNASTKNGFNFGVQSTSEKPFAAAAPFSISSPTAQNTTQAINNFTFGGASASTSTSISSSSSTTAAPAPSIATSTASKFTFGDVSAQSNSFNSNAVNKTSVSFGFGPNFSSTKPQMTVDGPSKKETNISAPFTFNATTTIASPVSKSEGFTFGSSSLSSTESNQKTSNIFSASLPKSNVKPTFSFGGSTSSAVTAPTKPFFESPSLNATVSVPAPSGNGNTFGAVAAVSAGNSQSKTFTFGSHNNSAATKNSLNTKSNGGFFFNPDSEINAVARTFGGSSGNPANTASPNASSPFTFGSSIQNDASTNSGKPFPSSAPATNLFGAVAMPKASTFNFGTNSTSTAPAAPAVNSNVFVSPQQNASSGMADRPFRRATRRLQKP